ncbi:hypothetical protein IFM89_027263 [Coptis chinensis]|uniref:PRONE domain-containing protein n=1 Tax=Coptis chinensis TaxID=261450 RepID=A0A835IVC8_9MAGN|nr:hypothetical protein IFM89_027263 [Coptis chinensis]
MRKRLACCHPFANSNNISVDLDVEPEKIMTYNGLESCILNSCKYDDESSTSRTDGCVTDFLDEDDSCSSSSKDASGSFSSQCLVNKHGLDEQEEISKSPQHMYLKEKQSISIQTFDVETMKEKFSKLLLGEDITGGRNGLTTALALSNAITNLAASVFGELWKLEPLSEERKSRWQREMRWFLSPTNYMVELVPAKQNGTSGQTLEIMTPKLRSDIHVNLPALQKLDSMLIETLDSMVNTEFWYVERGSRAEGRTKTERPSKRWWLPSPQVPMAGLSTSGRKKLLYQGKVVDQSGRANLGENLYKVLSTELNSPEEMLASLDLKNEHTVLQIMNKLETGVLAWKQKISEQVDGRSPLRNSWSLMKDSVSELDKAELLLERAETLLQLLKIRFPNLPQTFLDVTKVQYNKDVGYSILEAYSRIVGSLAFSVLSRIKDILQEDELSNPNSPAATCCYSSINLSGIFETPRAGTHLRHSLIDQMNKVDGESDYSNPNNALDVNFTDCEVKTCSLTSKPSRSRVWYIGKKACSGLPRTSSL